MRRFILTLCTAGALVAAAPALADSHGGEQCSSSMLATVRLQMPPLNQPVDPAQLSCNGLAQVYFLLTQGQHTHGQLRQRILAVFRRENLIG